MSPIGYLLWLRIYCVNETAVDATIPLTYPAFSILPLGHHCGPATPLSHHGQSSDNILRYLQACPCELIDHPANTVPDPVPIAIVGGTGLSSLPSPPFTPLALLPPPQTPWGLPSSPIAILSYTPPSSTSTPDPKATTIAFLARHGLHHQYAPHEVPNRANVAALKRLGVTCAVSFSAVGSLKEEVKPRDFVVVDQVLDWTKGVSHYPPIP